jgi:hypothetical protein
MYEDEKGLYVENLLTGQTYSLILHEQDNIETLNQKIIDLETRIAELEALMQ